MTAAEVRRDQSVIAAYILIARRMANCTRTNWHGRNGGTIDHVAAAAVPGDDGPDHMPDKPRPPVGA